MVFLSGKSWDDLDTQDRKSLLMSAYPNRSQSIVKLESKRRWNELWPSTQKDLANLVDWSISSDVLIE